MESGTALAVLLGDFRDLKQVSKGAETIRAAVRGDDDIEKGFGGSSEIRGE